MVVLITALAVLALLATTSQLTSFLAQAASGSGDWERMKAGERSAAIGQMRLALVQISAAAGAGVALTYTARNYRLSHRGQVTDRFIKALERIGSEEMYVRIGGILSLEQIVQDSPDQGEHAAQVLNAYIRQHTPRVESPSAEETAPLPRTPREDIQVALTVVTQPAMRQYGERTGTLDLSGLHLAGINLWGADLSHAWLHDACLSRADLGTANVGYAILEGTDLSNVNLTGAGLNYARISPGVNFAGANLTGANLSLAMHVSREQILSAQVKATTRLHIDLRDDPLITQAAAKNEGISPSPSWIAEASNSHAIPKIIHLRPTGTPGVQREAGQPSANLDRSESRSSD
ncbi:pentapeptide repeat-containing protein [Streptomyces sp. CS7]|uniref:pentapeptide repeat-containing protein n=1 Tax=Streptomyces sp. CS-7 TaxID=2906769 RepID=UPI0021B1BAC7|nr:pentapeptide repeat-containing protein [Streptomyces sp. CS-7]MCT6780103.1 pentapeptide repeat-containing protein [Streptomyces sp. CS-7]